jgi:flagellar hook-associated protein 1 FlgK
MSLNSALQIGRTGLAAGQAGIEVAGNNLANAATRGYHRQRLDLVPIGDQEIGRNAFVGRGVQIEAITRQINEALEARLRSGISSQNGSIAARDILTQIEGIQNELTDNDLSSHLNAFFNAWNELANAPGSFAQRSLVVQEGANLAQYIRDQRTNLVDLRNQVDDQIEDAAGSMDDLLTQIETLNLQIIKAGGAQGAHSLRDQRDLLLTDLATFADISIIEQESGSVDVFIGSTPIILNGKSRGVELKRETIDGEPRISLIVSADGQALDASQGKIGGLIASRQNDVAGAIEALDEFAGNLIYQLNRVHSQGQGALNFGSVTATTSVEDTTAALSDAAAGLAFVPEHGSFLIHVTQSSTGQRTTSSIDIDLDGIGADTSLDDLIASIDAVAGIGASKTADGRLVITADTNDIEISFSDDTSGILASLGVNTYFAGSDAQNIAVNSVVGAAPDFLATGRNHVGGDNSNALAIAALRTTKLDALGGVSIADRWTRTVQDFATRLASTRLRVETEGAVVESLSAQQQSISGVNSDEEAINLLSYQRAYQGSARFLNAVDEMMQTLLSIV